MQDRGSSARGRPSAPGSSARVERPGQLALATGGFDDRRASLEPEHPLYCTAWIAYHHQDRWGPATLREVFGHLCAHWPRARARRSDREQRAFTAWVLHDGHGMALEALAAAYGCERDTAARLVRDGRQAAPGERAPTRVPRVWAVGHEPPPAPPFDHLFEPPPIAFSFAHPEPRAFGWEDERGRVLALPFC